MVVDAARVSLRTRKTIAFQRSHGSVTAARHIRSYRGTDLGSSRTYLMAWHRSCEESRRLEEIPGVGPIVATALVARWLIGGRSRRGAF